MHAATKKALEDFAKQVREACQKLSDALDADDETPEEKQGDLYSVIDEVRDEVRNAERVAEDDDEAGEEPEEEDDENE